VAANLAARSSNEMKRTGVIKAPVLHPTNSHENENHLARIFHHIKCFDEAISSTEKLRNNGCVENTGTRQGACIDYSRRIFLSYGI
jgi:hypothetical protein